MKRGLFLTVLCALSLTSCFRDEGPIEELNIYVERFLKYADSYGYNFRDEEHELKVRFSDLDEDKAGVCYMNTSHPILVEFDSAYWRKISGNTNSEYLKENLVFHELGHGLLRRRHDNAELANHDWKTIMCGDELPDGRSPNINYRGERRQYYIEELFDQNTKAPAWSTLDPDFSGLVYEHAYTPDLTSNESPFTAGQSDYFTTSVSHQGFSISNTKNESALYAIKYTDFDSSKDFLFEITLSSNAEEYGVLVGQCDVDEKNYNGHYVYLTSERHQMIGELTCAFPFIDLYHSDIGTNSNKISIRRVDDVLYYYLNDKFVYHDNTSDLPTGGGYVCIPLMARSTTVIKQLAIYRNDPMRRSFQAVVTELPCPPLRRTPHDR